MALLKLDTDGSRPIGEISESWKEKTRGCPVCSKEDGSDFRNGTLHGAIKQTLNAEGLPPLPKY